MAQDTRQSNPFSVPAGDAAARWASISAAEGLVLSSAQTALLTELYAGRISRQDFLDRAGYRQRR